jgi:hypothetical protein
MFFAYDLVPVPEQHIFGKAQFRCNPYAPPVRSNEHTGQSEHNLVRNPRREVRGNSREVICWPKVRVDSCGLRVYFSHQGDLMVSFGNMLLLDAHLICPEPLIACFSRRTFDGGQEIEQICSYGDARLVDVYCSCIVVGSPLDC